MQKVKFQSAAPWEEYAKRSTTDKEEVVGTVFDVDQRNEDKLTCLLIFKNVFSRVEGI